MRSLLLLFILAFTSGALAGPLGYRDGRWIFKTKESYFRTGNNYGNSGTETPLPSNGTLETFTTAFSLTHDMSNSFSLFTGLDVVYGKTRGVEFERTRFTPTDVRFGMDFRLYSGDFDIVPELQLTTSVISVDETSDDALVNEATTETRIGSYISKNFESFSVYGYLGYAHRTGGRSVLMPYELQSIFLWGDTQFSLGIWGHQSLTDDSYTNTPARRGNLTNRVNAGSLRFYAINPNLLEAGFSFGFPAGDNWFARLGASTTTMGTRAASGQTIWISLSRSFGSATVRQKYQEQKKVEEKVQEKKKQEFVPETYPEEDENPYDEAVKDLPPEAPQKKFKEPGEADAWEESNGTSAGPAPKVKLRSATPAKAKKVPKKKKGRR